VHQRSQRPQSYHSGIVGATKRCNWRAIGQDELRSYLTQRHQHELTPVHTRMGYGQFGPLTDRIAAQQDIHIYSARAVCDGAYSPQLLFDSRSDLQKHLRSHVSADRDDHVQKVRLVG
jgi:hypothetical protein